MDHYYGKNRENPLSARRGKRKTTVEKEKPAFFPVENRPILRYKPKNRQFYPQKQPFSENDPGKQPAGRPSDSGRKETSHGILDFYAAHGSSYSNYNDHPRQTLPEASPGRDQRPVRISYSDVHEEPGYLGICPSILRTDLACLRMGHAAGHGDFSPSGHGKKQRLRGNRRRNPLRGADTPADRLHFPHGGGAEKKV